METPESLRTSLQTGEWVMFIEMQGRLLTYNNKPSVQEIPEVSHQGSILTIQSTTIWSVHCYNEIHNSSQGSQTDGSKQAYRNPPESR